MFISRSSCWLLLSILSFLGSSSSGLRPLNVRCPNWWTGLGHAWTSKTSFDRNYLLSRSFKSRSQIIPMCFHSIFVAAAVPYKSCPIGSTKIVSHFSLSEQDCQPAPNTTDSWGELCEALIVKVKTCQDTSCLSSHSRCQWHPPPMTLSLWWFRKSEQKMQKRS